MSRTPKPVDWQAIEKDYRAGAMSVREMEKWYQISDTAIHRRAKAEGWTRPAKVVAPKRKASLPITPMVDIGVEATKPEIIISLGRNLALRLLDELDSVTTHAGELEDMIVADEQDLRRRQAMLNAISLSERANVLRSLGYALKTFMEASAPDGKKAQRQEAAEKVSGKYATPGAPKLVVSNR